MRLGQPPGPGFADLDAWWAWYRAAPGSPIERAISGGRAADRLAWAFASGYRAALQALVPSLEADRAAALCATEEGGAHPRAVRTRLEGGTVTGTKQWATLADRAATVLVLATEGEVEGRQRLRLVCVDLPSDRVAIEPMPPTPFVPEVGHFRLRFEGAPAARVLPGDGWADYVRPFRTVEDLHVTAAVAGHLLRVLRGAAAEELAANLLALRALAAMDPADPRAHVALSGAMAAVHRLAAAAAWEADAAAAWARDLPLLQVAASARRKRTEAAWAALTTAAACAPRG